MLPADSPFPPPGDREARSSSAGSAGAGSGSGSWVSEAGAGLAEKKPGTGLPEDQLKQVIGKIACRNIRKDELIQLDWLS